MAQIITPQKAKLGPDNNTTAYSICIYIYIYTEEREQREREREREREAGREDCGDISKTKRLTTMDQSSTTTDPDKRTIIKKRRRNKVPATSLRQHACRFMCTCPLVRSNT